MKYWICLRSMSPDRGGSQSSRVTTGRSVGRTAPAKLGSRSADSGRRIVVCVHSLPNERTMARRQWSLSDVLLDAYMNAARLAGNIAVEAR